MPKKEICFNLFLHCLKVSLFYRTKSLIASLTRRQTHFIQTSQKTNQTP